MANIDPVAGGTRTEAVRGMMGENGTQVSISREAARQLSQLAESNGITRKEMVERLILTAKV